MFVSLIFSLSSLPVFPVFPLLLYNIFLPIVPVQSVLSPWLPVAHRKPTANSRADRPTNPPTLVYTLDFTSREFYEYHEYLIDLAY